MCPASTHDQAFIEQHNVFSYWPQQPLSSLRRREPSPVSPRSAKTSTKISNCISIWTPLLGSRKDFLTGYIYARFLCSMKTCFDISCLINRNKLSLWRFIRRTVLSSLLSSNKKTPLSKYFDLDALRTNGGREWSTLSFSYSQVD